MNEYSEQMLPETFVYSMNGNPTIFSPNATYELPFAQTKDSLRDTEVYKQFLDNAISRFRKSRTYKNYKGFLMGLGLDHCQMHGNISSEMASIEMHHNILTIFDIALIITEHVLNTEGYITTFDLVKLLAKEHTEHRVQLVMLSLTPHQLFHNDPQFFIPSTMCVGNWQEFLQRYNKGITQDIAYKLLYYIKREEELEGKPFDNNLLELREKIEDWSVYNGN